MSCNAEDMDDAPICSYDELYFQATQDAVKGNLRDDWEEIASNLWNFYCEKGLPLTYRSFKSAACNQGHCNFLAMEKEALEKGFSSIEEYDEAELERIMNQEGI